MSKYFPLDDVERDTLEAGTKPRRTTPHHGPETASLVTTRTSGSGFHDENGCKAIAILEPRTTVKQTREAKGAKLLLEVQSREWNQIHNNPQAQRELGSLNIYWVNMGIIIKHANYANTGTEFTFQDSWLYHHVTYSIHLRTLCADAFCDS